MLERLPLYDGALTARAQAEQSGAGGAGAGGRGPVQDREQVGSTRHDLLTHPALAGLFEHVEV